MKQRKRNVIDGIAGLIPGYRGYAEREARRTSDKLLRESVAAHLIRIQKSVDDVVLRRVDAGQLRGLDELDRLKRELGICADAFRHAPAGGSGLMDDHVIGADDLDRVLQHDLELEQAVVALADAFTEASAGDDAAALLALRPHVKQLRDSIARRETVMNQVFD